MRDCFPARFSHHLWNVQKMQQQTAQIYHSVHTQENIYLHKFDNRDGYLRGLLIPAGAGETAGKRW